MTSLRGRLAYRPKVKANALSKACSSATLSVQMLIHVYAVPLREAPSSGPATLATYEKSVSGPKFVVVLRIYSHEHAFEAQLCHAFRRWNDIGMSPASNSVSGSDVNA
jgi:hypothetical protein